MVSESPPSVEKGASAEAKQRRGRGPAKSFPLTPFQEVLVLPNALHEHGVDGVLRRVTAFDRMGRSPESSSSRQLITDAARYGVTSGSYHAEQLRLDSDGKRLFQPGMSERKRRELEFELAIRRIGPFASLYERLKDKRVPASDVLVDLLNAVPANDRHKCADVFLKNLRYLGLVGEVAGAERIISIEQMIEDVRDQADVSGTERREERARDRTPEAKSRIQEPLQDGQWPTPNEPTVHIDINIHVGSDASPEQIEQIFASMARHFYRRGVES